MSAAGGRRAVLTPVGRQHDELLSAMPLGCQLRQQVARSVDVAVERREAWHGQ